MRKTIVCCLLAALLACGCTQTQIPKPRRSSPRKNNLTELRTQIDRLLTEMSATDYDTREKATKHLRKLLKTSRKNRKEILTYLQEHLGESKDPEIRERLESIIDRYQRPWKYLKKLRTIRPGATILALKVTSAGRILAFGTSWTTSGVPDEEPTEQRKELHVWDVATGKCIKKLKGHESPVLRIALSPDGKLLASGSADGMILLWDFQTGRCLKKLKGHEEPICSIALSPDGKLLASTILVVGKEHGADVRIWDTQTGKYLRTVEDATSHAESIAFSPDGKLLAAAGGEFTIRIWNPDTGKHLRTLSGHECFIRSLAFSTDGKLLASGTGPYAVDARVWDVQTGKCLHILKGFQEGVWGLVFSPDDRMLAIGDKCGSIRIFDPKNGKCLRKLWGDYPCVYSVVFNSTSSMLVSSDSSWQIILWGIPDE